MKPDKQDARRAAIEAKALELLNEKGFEATSMAAIAKAASASIETLYRWYGDKQGLFAALVARNADRICAAIEEASKTHSGRRTLACVAPVLLEVLTDGPAVALNRAAAGDGTGALGKALGVAGRERVVPLLRGLVEAAVARGELAGDPHEITETYVALVVGDLQVRRATRAVPALTTRAIEDRASRAFALLCDLYAAPAPLYDAETDAYEDVMSNPPLTLYLAAPRGFCAGVDRAIKIVEMALEKWGAPIYVRHEIVHNKFVVDALRDKGAVFVEELDECPGDRPVIFSAHGVPKSVPAEAAKREMIYVDATCPLVSKVHIEAERHHKNGLQMVMIGHEGHPETVGTMGQLPEGEVLLVETVDDVAKIAPRDPGKLAFITQTTLSVDDTAHIVAALQARFPDIIGPHKEDICYATTNRQAAIKAVAGKIDALLVIGAPNSSNSKRLVEVGANAGCAYAQLIQRAVDIDWRALDGIRSVGITAGASAPEVLVNEVIDAFRARYNVTVELAETAVENVEFKVPRVLREPA